MGSKGDAFDNAVTESFFATIKKEHVHRHSWPSRRDLSSAVFEYIEASYNRQRRHSTLGYHSLRGIRKRAETNDQTALATKAHDRPRNGYTQLACPPALDIASFSPLVGCTHHGPTRPILYVDGIIGEPRDKRAVAPR
jgi:hypothetical protein